MKESVTSFETIILIPQDGINSKALRIAVSLPEMANAV